MKFRNFITYMLTAATLFFGYAQLNEAHASNQRVKIDRPFRGKRPFLFDAHLGAHAVPGGGVLAGVRFGIPIVQNGFIPSINNAVHIVVGGDFIYSRWYNPDRRARAGFYLPVLLNWEFYFNDQWSAFGEVGPSITIVPGLYEDSVFPRSFGSWFTGAVGGRFHFNERMALVLRIGAPTAMFGFTASF